MKKLITMILLMWSILAVAQEKEIWACQTTDITGFKWVDGEWKRKVYDRGNILLTLDGQNSATKIRGVEHLFNCNPVGSFWQCNSDTGHSLVLNPDTGEGGYSRLFGAVINSSQIDLGEGIFTEDVIVALLQCTKF